MKRLIASDIHGSAAYCKQLLKLYHREKCKELILLKKDTVTMTAVYLPAFFEDIQRSLMPRLKEKGIRLICKADSGRVRMEPDLIKSLLYNLVDNASKAIEQDGVIVIRATFRSGCCQLQVADNGRGMEIVELDRITEAFYRIDKARSRSQGGAGLGLALCQQIVTLHNGTIHFASTPGKGTKVTVNLGAEEVLTE